MQVKNTLLAATFLATGVTAMPAAAEPTPACNRDNCFRQLIQKPEVVGPFCATYTQSENAASTALPTFVSSCQGSPSRVSSACSCLHPATTSTAAPTATVTPIVNGWVNYTAVQGIFLQDDPNTNPTGFDWVRQCVLAVKAFFRSHS